jgi:serine/threonine protein phosphatase PrpC
MAPDTADPVSVGVKPLPTEVDAFGITHQGLVRKTNADHFIVASFHRAIRIHASSMPAEAFPTFSPDSRGWLLLVADGVGSLSHAKEGSAKLTDAIARHLVAMSEVSLQSHPNREREVLDRVHESVSAAHEQLRDYAKEVGGGAATTITMILMIWPCAFIAHAGDSRAYRLRDAVIERLTMDQTMAQVMVNAGKMSRQQAESSKLKNVLLSAAGSTTFDLSVSATDIRRKDRWLLCTDGLTRHVSETEIREAMESNVGSERVCRDLLALALERGGEDNLTIISLLVRD